MLRVASFLDRSQLVLHHPCAELLLLGDHVAVMRDRPRIPIDRVVLVLGAILRHQGSLVRVQPRITPT